MNLNNFYKNIKNNYKKIIISFLIFTQLYILKYYIGYYSPLHIEAHIGLYPILGLLFGGWGALGVSFANLLTDLAGGHPPLETFICFFVDFLYAYLPYKLWYNFSKNGKLTAPQLGTIFHLAKFCGVILVSTILYTVLIIMLLHDSQNVSLFSLTTLNYFLNAFVFGFFTGVIGIIISNLKNIDLTIPSVNKNPKIKDKWYNLALLIGIILIVVFFIMIAVGESNKYINLLFIISICILILFYRYKIKDVVRVTGMHNTLPEITFKYRLNQTVNLTGEKTTEEALRESVKQCEEKYGFDCVDFTVFADTEAVPMNYNFLIEPDNIDDIDVEALRADLEKNLGKANPSFGSKIENNTFGETKLEILQKETFMLYRDHMAMKGVSVVQLKPPRIIVNEVQRKFFYALREL